jgi:hypothetical protein
MLWTLSICQPKRTHCAGCGKDGGNGVTIEEILSTLNNTAPKVEASFVIDTLKYLHMGDGVSLAALEPTC